MEFQLSDYVSVFLLGFAIQVVHGCGSGVRSIFRAACDRLVTRKIMSGNKTRHTNVHSKQPHVPCDS